MAVCIEFQQEDHDLIEVILDGRPQGYLHRVRKTGLWYVSNGLHYLLTRSLNSPHQTLAETEAYLKGAVSGVGPLAGRQR